MKETTEIAALGSTEVLAAGGTLPLSAGDFLNNNFGVIGRTASTRSEPNTSNKFHFWIGGDEKSRRALEIGGIVGAFADDKREITFGVVNEMRSYSDVESFISDYLSHDFGQAGVTVPTDISEVIVVTCAVMRNLSSTAKPVGRSTVFFPSSLGIRFAFGLVNADGKDLNEGAAVHIGIFENGDGTATPISVDEDFLLSPQAAHLNVSGISGLASKTSAVLFTVKSILTHSKKRVGVVMFNVKSKDLLYLDRPNAMLAKESDLAEWSKKAYAALEIEPNEFQNTTFFAPADPRNPGKTRSLRQLATVPFTWDLKMMYRDIPSLFNPDDWDEKIEGAWFSIQEKIERDEILTYAQLQEHLKKLIDDASRSNNQYPLNAHILTWRKLKSRLERFPKLYQGLISSAANGQDIPWKDLKDRTIFVIDIQMLGDAGQRLVFGRAVRSLHGYLQSKQLDLDSLIIFVDELNKFAPSGSVRSPLKSNLINITARGRTDGLILFGAEQFASSVDKEIVENCSTFLFGRTESNELRSPTYSGLSEETKGKITSLPQGHLLAKFPKFSQPIFLRFPLPPCMPGDQYVHSEPAKSGEPG